MKTSSSRRKLKLRLEITLILAAFSAWAGQDRFYQRSAEGWFWYKDRPILEKKKPEAPPQRPPTAGGGQAPFSAAWLKENLPKFRERAIDSPTPENVAAYFALQRLAIDKAERFAKTAALLPALYPSLDENLRRPLAAFAANLTDKAANEGMDRALSEIAKTCGIFFFFQSTCPHCLAQAELLEAFSRKYGFTVFPISLDGNPLPNGHFPDYRIDSGQAEALSVMATPALFLVRPDAGNDRIRLISQSALALSDLERRIVDVAFQAGWIDRETYEKTLPAKPIHLQETETADSDLDPQEVLEALGIKVSPKDISGGI